MNHVEVRKRKALYLLFRNRFRINADHVADPDWNKRRLRLLDFIIDAE